MDQTAAIEKNRQALLRMVGCWLIAALLLLGTKHKTLPPRIARWVNELVTKAEKATHYLVFATACAMTKSACGSRDKHTLRLLQNYGTQFLHCGHLLPDFANAEVHLSVKALIVRLKAMRHTLNNLPEHAQRLTRKLANQIVKTHGQEIIAPYDTSEILISVFRLEVDHQHKRPFIPP